MINHIQGEIQEIINFTEKDEERKWTSIVKKTSRAQKFNDQNPNSEPVSRQKQEQEGKTRIARNLMIRIENLPTKYQKSENCGEERRGTPEISANSRCKAASNGSQFGEERKQQNPEADFICNLRFKEKQKAHQRGWIFQPIGDAISHCLFRIKENGKERSWKWRCTPTKPESRLQIEEKKRRRYTESNPSQMTQLTREKKKKKTFYAVPRREHQRFRENLAVAGSYSTAFFSFLLYSSSFSPLHQFSNPFIYFFFSFLVNICSFCKLGIFILKNYITYFNNISEIYSNTILAC